MMRTFTPRSRKAWRDWLAKNHASVPEVTVVFYKRHTGKPTVSYNDAVEEALCFGWIDGIKRSLDEERYSHRFTPRLANSNWSAANRKRVERLIGAGLMTEAGLRLVDDAKRTGTWERPAPDRPDRVMPPELKAALASDGRAAAFFDSLAPSCRRQYVGWVGSAKRADTRNRRVKEAVSLLRRGEKLGMR